MLNNACVVIIHIDDYTKKKIKNNQHVDKKQNEDRNDNNETRDKYPMRKIH